MLPATINIFEKAARKAGKLIVGDYINSIRFEESTVEMLNKFKN